MASNSFTVADMLSFDTLIAPRVLKVVYWIGLVGIAIFALISFFGAFTIMQYSVGTGIGTMVGSIVGLLFGTLLWRVMIEIYMIFFQIHERLVEIRDQGRGGNRFGG